MVGDFERMKAAREREANRKAVERVKQNMKRNNERAAAERKREQEAAYGIAAHCAAILDIVVKDLKRQNLLSQDACIKLGGIGELAMHELKRVTPRKHEGA